MTEQGATLLAEECLTSVKQRMIFSECYDEAVRNVAAAIKAAAEQAEADALSFKSVDTNQVSFGEMF